MSVARTSEGLLDLAKSRAPADRERLLLGITALCDAGDASAPHIQALLHSIFLGLVVGAEREIRRRLADKLAGAAWTPPALVNVLSLDEIEIARPIIASSPVLQDSDLIRLLIEATIEHQIEVARRPNLGAPVVSAILDAGEPAVMTALASNTTAAISNDHMARLVQAARDIAPLRQPLSCHPRLTSELALQLYKWVGETLRDALVDRFRLDPAQLEVMLGEAVQEAHAAVPDNQGLVILARDGERESMERRLIDKLHSAGQLRPGYLVRVLQEGRLSLFVTALATLGDFDVAQVQRGLDSDKPEVLGLACAAIAIDRSVFPTILDLVRQLNGGRPGGGIEGAKRAIGAFGPFSAEVAAAAFRQAAKLI